MWALPPAAGPPPLLALSWQVALRSRTGRHGCPSTPHPLFFFGEAAGDTATAAPHCSQRTGWQVGGGPLWQQVEGGGRSLSSRRGQPAQPCTPLCPSLPQACAGGWTEHGQGWPAVLLSSHLIGTPSASCSLSSLLSLHPLSNLPSSFCLLFFLHLLLSRCLTTPLLLPPLHSCFPFFFLHLLSSCLFPPPSPALFASPTPSLSMPHSCVSSLQLGARLGQRTFAEGPSSLSSIRGQERVWLPANL